MTLSGYLCAKHGESPASGDVIVDSGFRFTVIHSDTRRVREVSAEPVGVEEEEEDSNEEEAVADGGDDGES